MEVYTGPLNMWSFGILLHTIIIDMTSTISDRSNEMIVNILIFRKNIQFKCLIIKFDVFRLLSFENPDFM